MTVLWGLIYLMSLCDPPAHISFSYTFIPLDKMTDF